MTHPLDLSARWHGTLACRRNSATLAAAVAVLVICATATGVSAQEVQQHSETVAEPPDEAETLIQISAGAVLNTGNTRSINGNAGTRFSLKRSSHAFLAEANAVLGAASVRDSMGGFADYAENARNITGRIRYDFFMTDDDAVFIAVAPRHDPFAGLDLRLQNQLGYLRNFYAPVDEHRLWGELGYDLTYDNFEDETLDDEIIHSARLFFGYDNHLSDTLTFLTGVETLFDVEDAENVRIHSDTELRSKLGEGFQLGVKFTARWDNAPIPNTESLDTTTTLNLLYAVDLSAEDEEEAEATADLDAEPALM